MQRLGWRSRSRGPKNASFNSRFSRACIASTALPGAVLCCCLSVMADQNWDGDNPIGNFSYDNNWFGNTQPAWGFGNGSLHFSFRNNSSQTSLYNDYTSWRQTNDIVWDASFGIGLTWNGAGNGFDFNQRLENRSSFAQTLNVPLSGAKNGAAQIELNPVNGDLLLNANIYNDNNKPFYVYGSNGKTLTVNTALGGNASVTLNIEQNSNVVLKQANVYGGETFVRAGRLQFDTGGSVGSTIRLGATSGSDPAAIDLIPAAGGLTLGNTINPRSGSSGALSFNSQNLTGTNVYSGHFGLDHHLIVSQAVGGTLNITQVKGVDNSTGFDIKGYTSTFQADGDINVTGTIYNSTGSGNVSKQGDGVLTLSGANTYAGTTTVSGGTLLVRNTSGSGTGSSAVTVESGAALGGDGSVAGAVTIHSGGIFSAGSSVANGIFTASNDFTLNSGAVFHADISGPAPGAGGYDQLVVGGASSIITIGGATLQLVSMGNYFASVPPGYQGGLSFTLIDNNTGHPVSGEFAGLAEGAVFDAVGTRWAISYFSSGNDVVITTSPEPALTTIALTGLTGLIMRRRRPSAC